MSTKRAVAMLSRSEDQRHDILEAVSAHVRRISPIYGNDVLTATYIEPEMTSGGIILPEQRTGESVYQGKVGLVLAFGVDAFKYRDGYSFFAKMKDETDIDYTDRCLSLTPKIGDWVFYRPIGNLWKCTINGFACQFVRDSEIKGRVDSPEIIF